MIRSLCTDYPDHEVEIVSGLVVRLSPQGGAYGVWSSHILVTTDDAVDVFGLSIIMSTVKFAA